MGASNSVFDEHDLEEYTQLTYLSRPEILELQKKFAKLVHEEENFSIFNRYPVQAVKEIFPQIKYNPFNDRIYDVFSSCKDRCFSFEDVLDLFSVMSNSCPTKVKAVWAFRIFDFDDDGQLSARDLMMIINRLTQGIERDRVIPLADQQKIIDILMQDLDLESNGSIGQQEFEHAVSKMPDFHNTFSFEYN